MRDAGPSARNHGEPARGREPTVKVWDWPLRLWHWLLAVQVLVACVTPNAYDRLHRLSGYSVIVLLAFRLFWGIAGSRHARFDRLALKLRAAPKYLASLLRGETGRYLGLNPAGALMLVVMLALLSVSTMTGALQVTLAFFGVWWIETTHAYASYAIVGLAAIHVAGALLMSLLQRENLVRAMITGRKRAPGAAPGRPIGGKVLVAAPTLQPGLDPVSHATKRREMSAR